jgi:hypothetical protein
MQRCRQKGGQVGSRDAASERALRAADAVTPSGALQLSQGSDQLRARKIVDRRAESSSLRSRVLWGARWGLRYGLFYSALAGLGVLLRGPGLFTDNHVTALGVLLLYLGGGPLVGSLIGLLRPLAQTAVGAMIVGIVATVPVMVGVWR